MFMGAVLYGYSQTTVETALSLQEGNNSYTFEATGSSQKTVYYTYTAPAEQGKLIYFTAITSSTNCQMSLDGTYNTMISGMYLNNYTTTAYPVSPGQTVILAVSGYDSTIEFTIAISDADTDGGKTCDDAIALTETDVFVPCYLDRNTYTLYPTYLTYTCIEDGVLEIKFSGSVSGCTAQIGCDATSAETITVNSSTGGSYIAKYEVSAGNTYIFQISTYSPLLVSVKLTHPVIGQSCDLPFDGAASNILPKEAGTYWYKYTAEKAGFMLITSENSLAGGTLSIWSSCTTYQADATIDGYFALRSRVYSDYSYLICIEKTETTAADEAFSIAIEDEQAGDSQNNPIVITTDENIALPQYNGTYYYSVTVPEGDSRFLIVSSNKEMSNTATTVGIYNQYDTYTALATGTNYAKAEVSGNTTYIIKWTCNEGYNAFPFTIYYEEIAQGETCNNPLTAVAGANDLAAGNEKYYEYTATQNGWLIIDTDVTIDVTFLRGCSQYSGTYYATKTANITKTELQTGEKCIIKFANIEEETTFFLSEEEYAEGESCETATQIELGSTNIPEKAGNYWYRILATQDGVINISSDIIYEQSSDYSRASTVKVLTNCNDYGTVITQSNSEGTTFNGSFVVTEGDVLFINVLTISAQEGKTLTTSIRDLNPGESCTYPIVVTPGELTLPIVSRSNPVWYSIKLEPGEFSITSSNYNYFSMYLYENCDATSYIASSSYDYNNSGYSLKYNVESSNTYYLKLDGTYNETVVQVNGTYTGLENVKQEKTVRVVGNNIVVTGNNRRAEVVICDIAGKIIAAQAVYDQTTFAVDNGIYIVKVGNQVTKVAIR